MRSVKAKKELTSWDAEKDYEFGFCSVTSEIASPLSPLWLICKWN
jgi:hypothetical protein